MNKQKEKKTNKFLNILSGIFILCGTFCILHPFWEVHNCNNNITKNVDKWDLKKEEIKKNHNKNKLIKNKYPVINIDGKTIIGKIIVIKTGEEISIIKGATKKNLKEGSTIYENGVYPGDNGTSIILGHRDTAFSFLQNIQIDDEIHIENLNNIFKFKVYKTYITTPNDNSMFDQSNKPSLTLITCYPFRYLGAAPKRFVVNLKLIK